MSKNSARRRITVLTYFIFASTTTAILGAGAPSSELSSSVSLGSSGVYGALGAAFSLPSGAGVAAEVTGPSPVNGEAALHIPVRAGLEVGAGYGALDWGPGRHNNPMLSDTAASYPYIYSSGTAKGVRWEQFYAGIDDVPGTTRRLSGHRLETNLGPLTLGVAETAVAQGAVSPVIYIPLPFIPLQARQFFADRSASNLNLNADVYGAYRSKFGDLYGEYFVDHIAGLPWERPVMPISTATVVGYKSAKSTLLGPMLGLEYSRVEAPTYSHGGTGHYLYQGQYIGSPLGPSADMVNVDLSLPVSKDKRWAAGVSASVVRQGQWKVGDPWSVTKEKEAGFPAGIDQITQKLDVKVTRSSKPYAVTFNIGAEHILGVEHVQGTSSYKLNTGLSFTQTSGKAPDRNWGPGFFNSPSWNGETSGVGIPLSLAFGPGLSTLGTSIDGTLTLGGTADNPSQLHATGYLLGDSSKLIGVGRVSGGRRLELKLGPMSFATTPYLGLGVQGYTNPTKVEDIRLEGTAGIRLALPVFRPWLRLVAGGEAGLSRSLNDVLPDSYLKPIDTFKTRSLTRLEFGTEVDLGAFTLRGTSVWQPTSDFKAYKVPSQMFKLTLGRKF